MKKILSLILAFAILGAILPKLPSVLGTNSFCNYRWEVHNDEMISVSTNGNTENPLNTTSGSITDGKFSNVKYTLEQAIILKHDNPWVIEWKSSGTWTDTTDGALLFAGNASSTVENTEYLYRRHNSDFIAFGIRTGGQYHNYGVSLSANGIDGTAEHVYRLENRITNEANMVYLYVDGVEIAPMNHHWAGGTDKKETVDWLNGRDLTFTNMGTSPHTIGNCYIEYIRVSEGNTSETSTFEILDTRCNQSEIFTYEVGMTWREWLNSKYNTGMGSSIAIWVSAEHPLLGKNPSMDIFVDNTPVDYDSVIQNKNTIELIKY